MTVGTYILQTSRAKFNQLDVDGTCRLCNLTDETLEHFLLDCYILDSVRSNVFLDIDEVLVKACGKRAVDFTTPAVLQVLLDSTFLPQLIPGTHRDLLPILEHHTRRLCYILHGERQKFLIKTESKRRRCRDTQLSKKKVLN